MKKDLVLLQYSMALRVIGHEIDFVPLYEQLKKDSKDKRSKAMLEAIQNVKERLEKSNQPLGAHHKITNIPEHYKNRYGVSNALYHFDMPDDFRLMYTVRRSPNDGKKEALFLELISHQVYNQRFNYFKKKSH